MTVQDYPDYQQQTAVALALSAAGIPLLRGTTNIGAASGVNLPAAGQLALITKAAIKQPGFEGQVSVFLPGGSGTVPFAKVELDWFDSFTGLLVYSEQFFVPSGNGAANVTPCYLWGPCHGDQVSMTVTNLDPAVAATLTWGLNQTSHMFATSRLLQYSYAGTAPIGFTGPAGSPAAGVLATVAGSIAANGHEDRLIAAYKGKSKLSVDNVTGTAGIHLSLQDPGTIYSSNPSQTFAGAAVAAAAYAYIDVSHPGGPLNLHMTNDSASTAVTPKITLTTEDY